MLSGHSCTEFGPTAIAGVKGGGQGHAQYTGIAEASFKYDGFMYISLNNEMCSKASTRYER